MLIETQTELYAEFANQLKSAGITITPAELQGFLTGLACGGIQGENWQSFVYQFTNDNHAYPTELVKKVNELYEDINHKLSDIDGFDFELLLPAEDIFAQADALCEWAEHFLLGLGLINPKFDQEPGEIGEAVNDLAEICRLGYDEEDDPEELAEALEEIIEYVRTLATLFYSHFRPTYSPESKVLH